MREMRVRPIISIVVFILLLGVGVERRLATAVLSVILEPLLLAAIVAAIAASWIWSRRVSVALALNVLLVSVLVLHVNGYKLYGRATVVSAPPFEKARQLVRIEPPAILLFADGSSERLEGISVEKPIDFRSREESMAKSWITGYGRHNEPVPIRITSSGSGGVRAECLKFDGFFCGNAFHPRWLPERFPRHIRANLAEVLITARVADVDLHAHADLTYVRQLARYWQSEHSGGPP